MKRDMGGIYVNDRAVSVLENYEIEVLRTWKGRGAMLKSISEQGFPSVESILKTKEGELIVYDQDRTPYILKTYFEGRECNVRDTKECIQAVKTLARLHKASFIDTSGVFPGAGQRPECRIDKSDVICGRMEKGLRVRKRPASSAMEITSTIIFS